MRFCKNTTAKSPLRDTQNALSIASTHLHQDRIKKSITASAVMDFLILKIDFLYVAWW